MPWGPVHTAVQTPSQAPDQRICVLRRGPSTVLDVSPTGRNGHHRQDVSSREVGRSRGRPHSTAPGKPGGFPAPDRVVRKPAERLLQWEPHRKATGSPVRLNSPTGWFEAGRETATVGHLAESQARSIIRFLREARDLTPKSEASNLEGLPRDAGRKACRWCASEP